MILTAVVSKLLYTFFKYGVRKFTLKTRNKFDDILVDVIEEPLIFLLFLGSIWFSLPLLSLPYDILQIVGDVLLVGLVLAITFFITRLSDKLIASKVEKKGFKADTNIKRFLPALQRLIRIIIFIVAALVIFEILGLKLTSLLAGLGLGGLAVALAAKDTLSNLFGSVSVISDQTFKIGDKIKVDKFEGIVQDIGMRSTRIKTPSKTQVIIPNTKMANSIIENVSRRENRRKDMLIVLKQGTKSEKIKLAVDLIKESFKGKHNIDGEIFVNFVDITTVGPVIDVIYRVEKLNEHRKIQEQINFDIIKAFEKNNIELSQTTLPMKKGINY